MFSIVGCSLVLLRGAYGVLLSLSLVPRHFRKCIDLCMRRGGGAEERRVWGPGVIKIYTPHKFGYPRVHIFM